MRKSFSILLVIHFVLAFAATAQTEPNPFASPPLPPNGGEMQDVSEPESVPFDGGLAVLLASGAAYGLARIRNRRKH